MHISVPVILSGSSNTRLWLILVINILTLLVKKNSYYGINPQLHI